jgi:hypothetical protein
MGYLIIPLCGKYEKYESRMTAAFCGLLAAAHRLRHDCRHGNKGRKMSGMSTGRLR